MICRMLALALLGAVLTALSLAADTVRPEGWQAISHSNDVSPSYDIVFEQDVVLRIDFEISPEDWQAMLEDLYAHFVRNPQQQKGKALQPQPAVNAPGLPGADSSDPIYVEATCRFGGLEWQHVGIRFKGNSSLQSAAQSGTLKIPFHLEFDHFEDEYPEIDNQRFYGFKDLSLSNAFRDSSLVREKTTNDLFRAAGVPCAESAFYRVYIDYGEGPQYFGLYTMTEIPGDPMLDRFYGNSDGNLYKPEAGAGLFSVFKESAFEKKTNADERDWADVISLIDALNATATDPAAWREELEQVLNVQAFLRWLAVDTVLGNWDTYGDMAHNFYIYTNDDDGLINWIPWDNNEALSDWFRPIRELSLASVGAQWPMIRRVADDPVYYACYLRYVEEALDSVLDVATLQETIRSSWELIQPYVTGANHEQPSFTLLHDQAEFTRGLQELLDYVARRHAEVEEFLLLQGTSRPQIAITELQYNPAPEQGEDEDYEFIELCNLGERVVSLAGWQFVDGIEFVFPASSQLEAGACLLVAKTSATYTGIVDCQVHQWTSGKLANGGERVELVDADGVCVDVVVYDDDEPWPETADGGGYSLVPIDAAKPNDLVLNWEASRGAGGSPGWIEP